MPATAQLLHRFAAALAASDREALLACFAPGACLHTTTLAAPAHTRRDLIAAVEDMWPPLPGQVRLENALAGRERAAAELVLWGQEGGRRWWRHLALYCLLEQRLIRRALIYHSPTEPRDPAGSPAPPGRDLPYLAVRAFAKASGGGATSQATARTLQAFLDALNSGDDERLASLLTNDATVSTSSMRTPISGRRAAAGALALLWQASPGLAFYLESLVAGGNRAAAALTQSGTGPGGQRWTLDTALFCDLRGGLVRRAALYYHPLQPGPGRGALWRTERNPTR